MGAGVRRRGEERSEETPKEGTQKGRNEEEREGATVVKDKTGRSYLGDGQLNVSPYEVFALNLSE